MSGLLALLLTTAALAAEPPDEVEVPLGEGVWMRFLAPVPGPGGAGCFRGWCALRDEDFTRMNAQAKGNCKPKTEAPAAPPPKEVPQGDPASMRSTGRRA